MQGDIVAVYNAAGTKLISYAYNAWGEFTTTYHNSGDSTTAINNPYLYRGYYYDYDLGLYYLESRYYDANTCRFINADNALYHTMHGYNLFAYCNNNPVNYVDYTGENAVVLPWIGIEALVAFGEALIATAVILGVFVIVVEGTRVVINYAKEKAEEKAKDKKTEPPQSLDDEDQSVDLPNNNDPNKSQWPVGENGVKQTQEAWQNGNVDPKGNPYGSVRKGFSNDGTFVRVHIGADGSIHGYPIFP